VAGAVFGRYELIDLIGEGGMGQVFRAHDTVMRRPVAIKVLPADLANQPGYRQRFEREAYTAARLTNPHVIPIYELGEIEGRLYLSMPVIDGIDLATLLRRQGPMNPQLAVKVIEQLASALDAAHGAGLVHRDVKPSNALMAQHDFVYLIDFGIAHDEAATKLTQTGSVLGTLAYMAPERFETGIANPSADVYALGALLHECLTGDQPFPGNSLPQQMHAHLYQDPPRPSTQRPGIPTRLDTVVARGMAKDATQRYPSATELAAAARDALTPQPDLRPPSPQRPPTPPAPPQDTVPAAIVGPRVRPAPAAPDQNEASRRTVRIIIAVGLTVAALIVLMLALQPKPRRSGLPATPPVTGVGPMSVAGDNTAADGAEYSNNRVVKLQQR
jgi:serine/threonine protein kinase